jgi:murein L,D-transpeptidase YafK
MRFLAVLFFSVMLQGSSFKETQLKHDRVKKAYADKENVIREYFKVKQIGEAGFQLFIRAFKHEKELEVWVRQKDADTFTLLHTYDFCTTSGTLGPKRREGDLQIPEGVYNINHFNPRSNFHLSLGLNYPNASDKILSDKKHPGGAIYIHGNCVTVGCIPITDDKIKELYILAVEAKHHGQEKIPVHIFPARLTSDGISFLKASNSSRELLTFWQDLKMVFDDFEKTKRLRTVKVTQAGRYVF